MRAEDSNPLPRRIDRPIALLATGVMLICTYYILANIFQAPYPGLDYDKDWVVLRFDDVCAVMSPWCQAREGTLQVGDQLLTIGTLTHEAYDASRLAVPFAGYERGDLVPVTFLRNGEIYSSEWPMLGPTGHARLIRLSSLLFCLPYWLAGTALLLFLRPRDARWSLLILFSYVTALYIAVGVFSPWRVAGAALVLRAVTLLMVPLYLHLHLIIPTPLKPERWRALLPPLYLTALVLALVDILWPLSQTMFWVASLSAVLGSLLLLIYRSFAPAPPSVRVATRLMLTGVSLAFGPGVLLWVVPTLLSGSSTGWLLIAIMTVAIPLQPLFYVYALYKHRLGNLEFRANRLLSLYSFILLYITAFLITFTAGSQWIEMPPAGMAFALLISLAFVTIALPLREPFQRLVDRIFYGTVHNPDDIVRTFADEIPRALEREALATLLIREVAPSLLIRQSAIYLLEGAEVSQLFADGDIPEAPGRVSEQVRSLLEDAGRYRPVDQGTGGGFDWVRLAVPIEVGRRAIGVWLFGKRDPDDYYPRPDIELLKTLANQVGIALANARLFENLQHRATELEIAYRELQKLDKLKDEFVQNISHELRTPITFILGYTELLLEGAMGGLDPRQREALETMADRTGGLIRLVNDIISIQQAKLENTELEPISLVALARSCLQAAEVTARKQARNGEVFDFQLEASDGVPLVLGDRRRLGQVLDNLMNNAIKFSPSGGTIAISITSCLHQFRSQDASAIAQPAVSIAVRDQGIGIPADQIEDIWQRFYQVDGSSTRRFGGMGLGLSIVQSIVQSHQGDVWVESQEGKGSTFYVVLPVAPANNGQPVGSSAPNILGASEVEAR